MIDIGEIYDSVCEDVKRKWRSTTTVEGASMRVENYTYKPPSFAIKAISENLPIDLNNRLKHVRRTRFDAGEIGNPLYERRPVDKCFGRLELGPGIEAEVDYSRPVRLYAGGLASVGLVMTDQCVTAVVGFLDALEHLPDLETQKKEAKARAEEEWRKAHPFDEDGVYKTRSGDKVHAKNQGQAVNKKREQHEANAKKAGKDAEDDVVRDRNSALAESGLSNETARLVLGGSLDADSSTLYWYPTLLDLARMFEGHAAVPTECIIAIDDNDEFAPGEDPDFSRDLLAESYYSATNGKSVFDDIRDSLHSWPDKSRPPGPFPAVKPTRWDIMKRRFAATSRPAKPGESLQVFVDDNKLVWTGGTGPVLYKFMTKRGSDAPVHTLLTGDGLCVLYSNPARKPFTAFFMTSVGLAEILREGLRGRPPEILVALLKNAFLNAPELLAEAPGVFAQRTGGRRFIA